MPERVRFEMSYYSKHKTAVKKPFKALKLSWRGLPPDGETRRGQYVGDDITVTASYSTEHADFILAGDDQVAIEQVLEAWSDMPTERLEAEEAPPSPADEAEAQAVAVWRFKEPVRREGEPDAFFEKRYGAWKAEDPREQ